MRDEALRHLRTALDRPDAEFRDGQLAAIEALLDRRRLLVVQRTGWGKSMVYFVATRLLLDRGAGFTLIVSPLLALMRNQLDAAARVGLRAATLDSTNPDEWDDVEDALSEGRIDVLFVSPERLGNQRFQENVLGPAAGRIGLFVVDEAHCISDWGHDFRPDYRRIRRVLSLLPARTSVLATTATANDRVVADVVRQLGEGVRLVRGPLARSSLRLQNLALPSPSARLAWLAEHLPGLPGSGIVYALTIRDAEQVAEWLRSRGIDAEAYHANKTCDRETLEQRLLDNDVKALVATVALGMGFDKPDLGFVVHYQRPASVVHYYQQVGRAGRALDDAYGILMHGDEDDSIADYFIRTAFPPQQIVEVLLDVLGRSEPGLSVPELERKLDRRRGELTQALKFLEMEHPAPVVKIGSKWNATAAARDYRIDDDHIAGITAIRRAEQKEMQGYVAHEGCLMEFLGRALDDPHAAPCGRCAGCRGAPLLPVDVDPRLAVAAAEFARRTHKPLAPRKRWPPGGLPHDGFKGFIGPDLAASEGRALSLWRDAGWGTLVARGKYDEGGFAGELTGACTSMIVRWAPEPAPTWVACVPSARAPGLVPEFARRLAGALGLPFSSCLVVAGSHRQQKHLNNGFHKARNLDGAFSVDKARMPAGPCFLVDDVVDSRWTFTVTSALLRRAGCPAVFPVALALNSPRRD